MIENWLKPLSAQIANYLSALPNNTLGGQITAYIGEVPDLKSVRVALIGLSEKEAAEVRTRLYSYQNHFPRNSIADLGNLRKKDPAFIAPLVSELMNGKILPLLIGGSDGMSLGQFLAYAEKKSPVNLASIDQIFRGEERQALHPILHPPHPLLFNFSLLGAQNHLMKVSQIQWMQDGNHDYIRLGAVRDGMEVCESVLRDADLLFFHLESLRQTEAPGVENPTASGLLLEEACQLSRYAGLSDKLTTFGIYGFQAPKDLHGQTAQAVAQICWYFLDGFFSRVGEFPFTVVGLTEYVVDYRDLNYRLSFWKSNRTGRWWMQIPVKSGRKVDRHRLIPCTYADYLQASQGDIPDRLIRVMSRFS